MKLTATKLHIIEIPFKGKFTYLYEGNLAKDVVESKAYNELLKIEMEVNKQPNRRLHIFEDKRNP